MTSEEAAGPSPSDAGATGSEWRMGWRVVAAAAAGCALGNSAFITTSSLFVIPMQEAFGWSRSAVSVGPIVGLVTAALLPIAGIVSDRAGAHRTGIAGLSMLMVALLLLAAAQPDYLTFYAIVGLVAVAGVFCTNIIFARSVTLWFQRSIGTALGITMSGVSLGFAVLLPVISYVIAQFGWRAGYVALAVLIALIALPLNLLWLRERVPVRSSGGCTDASLPGESVREIVKDRRFQVLFAVFILASAPIGGFISQLQPLLIGFGFSPAAAAAMMSVYVLGLGIGRVAIGVLLDYGRPVAIAVCCFLLSSGGALLLAFMPAEAQLRILITAAIFLIGLSQGAETDFLAFFTTKIFGVRNFATLAGILAMAVSASMALGGLGFAWSFDQYGSYRLAAFVGAIMFAVAALTMAFLRMEAAIASRSGRRGRGTQA